MIQCCVSEPMESLKPDQKFTTELRRISDQEV